MIKAITITLLSILMLTSCRFQDGEESNSEKMAHPDIVLEKATYLLNQGEDQPITLYGDVISLYSKDEKAEIEKISFEQAEEDGSIYLEGSADRATVDTNTKIIILDGNVVMRQNADDMELRGESITFDSENETVESKGKVTVSSKEGSFTGEDFYGDLKFSNYSFKTLETGVLNN